METFIGFTRNLTTEDYHCAVIKIDKANLREGPETNYSPGILEPEG